ncbi:MAG: hypothetical protein EOO15_00460 [Chitinophagaceae bacterium]|nr:MAG: hypothetical protein EOO15_00460 [Chitinophagaceae bacterium]
MDLTKPTIDSRKDLVFISGPYAGYTETKTGKGSNSLTFTLENYSDIFKIKADFFSALDKAKLSELELGENVTISIPKEEEQDLNTSKNPFFVYSLEGMNKNVLDVDSVVEKHNYNFMKYASLAFLLLGCLCFYSARKTPVRSPIF